MIASLLDSPLYWTHSRFVMLTVICWSTEMTLGAYVALTDHVTLDLVSSEPSDTQPVACNIQCKLKYNLHCCWRVGVLPFGGRRYRPTPFTAAARFREKMRSVKALHLTFTTDKARRQARSLASDGRHYNQLKNSLDETSIELWWIDLFRFNENFSFFHFYWTRRMFQKMFHHLANTFHAKWANGRSDFDQ